MPSLSASVPANKLKVMRPGKPVARRVPYQGAAAWQTGGASAASPGAGDQAGQSAAGASPPTAAPPSAAPPKLATGGGFQFRPRGTVGGPMVPGGPGAGADIQTAIKSLRGQLGMTPGAPSDAPVTEPGTGQDMQTASATTQIQPAWKQLADAGVAGQGSAAGNRAKLAELLAARTGGGVGSAVGGGAIGIEPGVGGPGPGQPPNPMSPTVATIGPSIRRMPATVSDPSSNFLGGDAGLTLQGNQGPLGPGPTAPAGPGQNPYMDILNRRGLGGFGGFGGGGGGGFNPGAAIQYAR